MRLIQLFYDSGRLIALSRKQSGQMLIESVLTIGVVVSVGMALVGLGILGMQNARFAADRTSASRALQEGFEILRDHRDSKAGFPSLLSKGTNRLFCIKPTTTYPSGDISADCFESDRTTVKPDVLVNNRFERFFYFSEIRRERDGDQCDNDCSACGPIAPDGTGFADNCSLKVIMQVNWPGRAENCVSNDLLSRSGARYCMRSMSLITDWNREVW